MRNSVDTIAEMKNITGRRSIRRGNHDYEEIASRKKLANNEDRSISEPPQSYSSYMNNIPTTSTRLKPILERNIDSNNQGSSDEDEEDLSKSNSQLNESDLDLEIPDSVSQTPTPTPLTSNSRRINSETNLNDSKRRLTGFLGNRSKRFCASTSELSFASHLDTHKSLFSPRNNLNAHSRQSSLFGSNASLNSTNSRLFMINSPFYNGKTTFGGASAYPKRDINQHKMLRTPVQMRPSSSLSSSSTATSTKSEIISPESNAAKRILGIMNQFSGDLKEARIIGSNINSIIKLPGLVQNQKRFGEEDISLERSISLSKPTAPYGRPSSAATKPRSESPLLNLSNAKNNMQIPTMTQLLKIKRLQNNTERIREIANRSESFLNHIQEYKLPANDNAHHQEKSSAGSSLKMKNQITKNLLRSDKNVNELPPTPLNLPNIQLPQLKSIPKFDIQLPITNTSNDTSKTSQQISSAPQFPAKISSTQSSAANVNVEKFNFSLPIRLALNDIDSKKLQVIKENFSFSKPFSVDVMVNSKNNQGTKIFTFFCNHF
jgi:nuclear pore complex protein Nup153